MDLDELVNEHGARFVDVFTLTAQIGRGCGTRVHVARDAYGRQAACKLARCEPRMRWSRVVRTFQREALLLQRCVHPNVVEYHGLYLSKAEAALVLGLAPGGDCQQLLMRHGALAEPIALSIIGQLCAALECIHCVHRMLHRDVKLENLLVCEINGASGCPRIQLCDFGHSCLLDQPMHGAAVDDGFKGTEGYAAPEVAAGGTWTAAADVWGVGVVFYALLANELLRWKAPGIPEVSTKTSRAFAQVSTSSKMLIKSVLLPELERATLADVRASVEPKAPNSAAAEAGASDRLSPPLSGLRRTMGSKSYSHRDLTSLDRVSVQREPHPEKSPEQTASHLPWTAPPN